MDLTPRAAFAGALLLFLAAIPQRATAANQYAQHNLTSDIPGVADQIDPNLINPWGIAFSAASPFWISNNHSGTAAVYNGQGQPTPSANPIVVI